MQAVIMAGGKGSRISSVDCSVPKPMIRIDGRPVLEYQVACLRKQAITELIFVVGYLHDIIMDYFGDGAAFGVHITYIVEDTPLGTAGALYFLRDRIQENFLLINGDIMFDVDIERFYRAHEKYGGIASIFTHPNQHPFDSAIVIAQPCGKVTGWLHKEQDRKWYQNRVNAGIHMFSPGLFAWMEQRGMLQAAEKLDLDRDVLKPMIEDGELFAYDSPEYVKDMGTPERYRQVETDVRLGRAAEKNLSRPQKAVFLDRDGTMNEYVGFLNHIDKFRLIDGVAEAVRRMNEAGWLVVVVTNQPVIARGELSVEELDEIHRKMETLLGEQGAYVDAVYYCPHHPDRGFEGERIEYKVDCTCRKPKPGMLRQAAEDYHIDLSRSWMAGDSAADMLAGEAAGCHTAGIGDVRGQDGSFRGLKEFADFLCGEQ